MFGWFSYCQKSAILTRSMVLGANRSEVQRRLHTLQICGFNTTLVVRSMLLAAPSEHWDVTTAAVPAQQPSANLDYSTIL